MLISDLHDMTEAMQWCEVCRVHKDGHCDACGAAFLHNERRYRSQTFHYHPAAIEGVAGTRAVQKELCIDCYRDDHAKAYPGSPVPDLPDRGVDPKFHAAMRTEKHREMINRIISELSDSPEKELLQKTVDVGLRFS
ncbi:MAG TPA: hypothetical protein VJQ59_16650 [Candidatus Sulfotelmatobacter sp.]|nr:hypothetical protein [Candidatus Sulfotelmatobacter sp.]